MVDSVKLAATAKRLIEANGREVTMYKRNRTPSNVAQPWRGPAAAPTTSDGDTLTPKIAFVPSGGGGLGIMTMTSAELEKSFDQIGLLASDSVTGKNIEDFDTIVDDAKVWKIQLVEELKPAGTSLIYALGLKA